MPPEIDYGPLQAILRGEVLREDRPDIEAPNRQLSGARRRDYLREMKARHVITAAEWEAVERFRDDLAIASGSGHGVTIETAGIRGTPGYGPTERQVDAVTRVRAAFEGVGLLLAPMLLWCIVAGVSGREYARMRRVPRGRALVMLHDTLEKLAAVYDA